MAVIIGADKYGTELKDVIKAYLLKLGKEVVDVSNPDKDFVDNTLAVAAKVTSSDEDLGIVVDAYGVGPFMVATKIKGMVAAEVSDERSAYMTRAHNNSRMITIGSEIVGPGVAKNIAKGFVEGEYEGGRHQIRVDMLNKMC
ncbi:galactose-6-phosphate isomerase subunit LacA [Enterococcus faecalis]|uniref:Galactose-6-phosphate isomerase subunit LacA n=1 Tax=Enterococcus faecalis TaxID=1351 RepID=A0ABD7IZ70_ENTFL|nr:galactose-6-phosphate isomerase subunit LacA [Enterococcus faecalis]EGG58762.1 galactose-6-phosphate isomerase, LacA subunit [Enterococcus faecalis TX1467]EGO2662373.1 galactose-6-phosphate isomerase subunit LacA [Enterococcus faecalis]EGO2743745.1 galactose-6-phosphate isomerase subunit LacA [Enterococcus faecalis]EGO2804087.1 galactose-6-phosphate isomerase subunit LacA [Enterococcus faecalis]EGO2812841.1 galactose-6-phosphate isomerase subunit LacA [Enterococcus faecalis]